MFAGKGARAYMTFLALKRYVKVPEEIANKGLPVDRIRLPPRGSQTVHVPLH